MKSTLEYIDLLLSKKKLNSQLIIFFSLATIIPVIFISYIMVFYIQVSLTSHYKEQTYSDNLRVKSILFDVTTNAFNLSEAFINDTELLNILNKPYNSKQELNTLASKYKTFEDVLKRDSSISSINIITFNEDLKNCSNFIYIDKNSEENKLFLNNFNENFIFWKSTYYEESKGYNYQRITLFRKIVLLESNSYAIISITIDNNYLKNRIDNNTLNSIVQLNSEPIFYSTEKDYFSKNIKSPLNEQTGYYNKIGKLNIANKNVIGTISSLKPYRTNDIIYITSYSKNALSEIYKTQLEYIIIVLFMVIILILLFAYFSHYFSKRVLILRKAMRNVSKGNYYIIDSFYGKDEFYEIFQDLKIMITEIKEKESLLYKNKLKEKKIQNIQQQMEFKLLASQINPHFLYNTLETIRMKAFTFGDKEVANSIKLLGKSLRYVLDNTGTTSTSLNSELEHIRTYIQIQKLRFGNRINYIEKIEDNINLNDYLILPLLIQPIIENSIYHGIELKDNDQGEVLLHIFKDNFYLYIQISDNGIGIEKNTLQMLKESFKYTDNKKTKSIGLYNINKRVTLYYGKECELQIESILNLKTIVTLKFPLNKIKEALK